MLGAALFLPLFLSIVLRLGERLPWGPFGVWLWADARGQLPGMSLALMALLLALAANIGVGTMVSSFRLTFVGWLDQRLPADLYVTVDSDSQGTELADWLSNQDVRTLPIRNTEIRHQGQPLNVYGIVDDPVYRQSWPLLDAAERVWDQVNAGHGVLINEQLARRNQLRIGDELALNGQLRLPISGIYSDYGNPVGQAMVSMAILLQLDAEAANRQFGIILPPDQVQDHTQVLIELAGIDDKNIANQRDIKARSLAVFDRTFVITAALNLLTLGVAAFAILTSLLTLWGQRLPQLAPLWAMGVTRRRLAAAEMLRSLLLAAVTALLSLPLGLILAWALLAVINVEAFGWKLPMYVFPTDWLWLFLLALIAAAIAALLPAYRLSRLAPSSLLKVFANER